GQISGIIRRNEEVRPGGWDPQARLADQDLDHVRAEVMFPNLSLSFFVIPDAEYQRECMWVLNDWMAEFCAAAPKRLIGSAMLPTRGPIEWAVAEAERAAKLGLRPVLIPCGVPERPYRDSAYEPLWAALEDLNMPVALHTAAAERLPFETFIGGLPFNAWATVNKILPIMEGLTGLIASAVPQNHPKLRFVMVEGGIGWIASVMRLMDHWWEDHRKWLEPRLEERPSAYFHRQFWATFEDDRPGLLTREMLNVDHLMWGSDYPHTEGTWPRSKEQIARDFAGVPEGEVRKMVVENAAQLYGIEVA
ncbi:MAG: amidohydrolase family protein, partial [Candidatus Binatia bacterium]